MYHRAKYLLKFRKVRNVIILAPAIATNMTWIPFLSINREQFRVARNNADLETVPEGVFIVLSTSMLGKLKRGMARFVKRSSRKLCLVFDESDEITNPSSQRTRHILGLFRRLKYKILDTGTTTRNNIAELYSQFELLYNNSINMVCWSSRVYHESRDKEIEEDNNPHYGEPFPAFRGHVLFRACHCPGKSTVFGIEKQNQDVYNKEELAGLIGKTVITRKFRDFAGEKYKIRTHTVSPSDGEREVYRVIIEEFCRICELYYNSTGGCKEGCRTPAYAPDQAAHQGLLRPTPDRGLFRRRDSEQDKVHRKAGTEDTRQSGCRLHVHSRIRPLREPSPRMFS